MIEEEEEEKKEEERRQQHLTQVKILQIVHTLVPAVSMLKITIYSIEIYLFCLVSTAAGSWADAIF